MSTLETYDGLCGNIARFGRSDLQLRCKYDLLHEGPCSWEKYHNQFRVCSSCGNPNYQKSSLNVCPNEKKNDK